MKKIFKNFNEFINENIEIVKNVNIGENINKCYNEWIKIKNEKEHSKWSMKWGKFRSGSYKNITLLQSIESFDEISGINSVQKENFLQELDNAIKKYDN